MTTIFITGGAGFIGSALVRRFLAADIKVIVYDDFSVGKRGLLPTDNQLHVIEGDINQTSFLREAIQTHNPDYICHLAALHFIPACDADPVKTLTINTVGTESLFNACQEFPIKKTLIASTAAVYAVNDQPNKEESTEINPVDIYGLSKHFVERLSRRFFERTGRNTFILRLFNAVGPRETNPHLLPHVFESLKTSDTIPLGNIDPKRDYIHTQDIAEAVYALCSSEIKSFEVFNIGSGKEYSVAEIIEILKQILKRPLKIEQTEQRRRKVDRPHLLADISKIKERIGWEPRIDIKAALEDMGSYYGII